MTRAGNVNRGREAADVQKPMCSSGVNERAQNLPGGIDPVGECLLRRTGNVNRGKDTPAVEKPTRSIPKGKRKRSQGSVVERTHDLARED